GQPEPRTGRPLRRLARARPELPVAPVPRTARSPDTRRRPLPHRGEHVARTRARGRLGHDRCTGAAAAAPPAPARRPGPPSTLTRPVEVVRLAGSAAFLDLA